MAAATNTTFRNFLGTGEEGTYRRAQCSARLRPCWCEGDVGPLAAVRGPLGQAGSVRVAVHDVVDPIALQQGPHAIDGDIQRPVVENKGQLGAVIDPRL